METRSKALIIGIEGFTGHHLSSFLKSKGLDVYGTSLHGNGPSEFKLDLAKRNSLKHILDKVRPDYVINLAGISFVGHPNVLDFYQVNTFGAEQILSCLLEIDHMPSKIILVSSATVYGNQKQAILSEDMTPKPINHYGCSKLAMEHIASNYFSKLPIIITRPFNYTGVGQSKNFLIPKLVSHFKERARVVKLGNLDVKREFNDVRFLCDVYFRLLSCPLNSKIVNVCTSVSYSIGNIIKVLQDLSGHVIDVEVNTDFVRKDEVKDLKGSPELLITMISLPQNFGIEDTLKKMLFG